MSEDLQLKWFGKEVTEHFERTVFRGVEGCARYLYEYIKRSFDTPKTGQLYAKPTSGKVGTRGKIKMKYWRASASGETPAVVTGKLRASIRYETGETDGVMWAKIGLFGPEAKDAPYGALLELGLGRLRGAKRPFIRPALDNNRDALKRIMLSVEGISGGQIARNEGTGGAREGAGFEIS